MRVRIALRQPWTAIIGWLSREAERRRLVLWLPVFMGTGVLTYYALRFEPPVWSGPAALLGFGTLAVLTRSWQGARLALPPLVALVMGFTAGQVATARAPPLLIGLPTHATVLSGRVGAVEALPDGRRITLEDARLDGQPDPLARRVRVRLRANDQTAVDTGDTVTVRALIRTPSPPAYPGGWDQQRDAFYSGLGASGFALGALTIQSRSTPTGAAGLMQRLREEIARHVLAAVPGAAGAICVTLLTGASMGIPTADHAAFRASGLAHLLAVAGLHIGIVMGFAFGAARLAFALSEHASLFWPTKKLAGLVALAAGGGYMVLTGLHVPIVRSFIMASLVTVALLFDRQAVSVRGLGLAGVALMLLEPQQVPDVSFQMSFAAVLALIAGYEALRPWLRTLRGESWHRRLLAHVTALGLTSVLAGTASMPYGAYHFGQIQMYYVIANMAAVPLTALWVMPAGLLALPLMPLGLDWLALVPMGWGAEAVLWVARTTASWPAATLTVPHIPLWGLCVVSVGLAWLGIWQTPLRLAGVLAIAVGVLSPVWDHPPDLLVSADARLIGLRTPSGVFFEQTHGRSAFIQDAWLQYWGDRSAGTLPLEGDAADGAVSCIKGACVLRPRPDARPVLLVRGATHPEGCGVVAVIVSAEPARGLCPRPWPQLVDRFTVWRYGPAAVWLDASGARVLTDRTFRGQRPWVAAPPTPRAHAAPKLPAALIDTGD